MMMGQRIQRPMGPGEGGRQRQTGASLWIAGVFGRSVGVMSGMVQKTPKLLSHGTTAQFPAHFDTAKRRSGGQIGAASAGHRCHQHVEVGPHAHLLLSDVFSASFNRVGQARGNRPPFQHQNFRTRSKSQVRSHKRTGRGLYSDPWPFVEAISVAVIQQSAR